MKKAADLLRLSLASVRGRLSRRALSAWAAGQGWGAGGEGGRRRPEPAPGRRRPAGRARRRGVPAARYPEGGGDRRGPAAASS